MYQKLGNSLGFIALLSLRLRLSAGQVVPVLVLNATGFLLLPFCVFLVRYKVYFGKIRLLEVLATECKYKKEID